MASCCTKGEISVKTVTINGKTHIVSGSILVYIDRLQLTRNAIIERIDKDTYIITDKVTLDRPITSLSSGYTTTIKEG